MTRLFSEPPSPKRRVFGLLLAASLLPVVILAASETFDETLISDATASAVFGDGGRGFDGLQPPDDESGRRRSSRVFIVPLAVVLFIVAFRRSARTLTSRPPLITSWWAAAVDRAPPSPT